MAAQDVDKIATAEASSTPAALVPMTDTLPPTQTSTKDADATPLSMKGVVATTLTVVLIVDGGIEWL